MLLTAATLTAAAYLLPHQLGGAATYVSTSGDSMRPGMHTGDLVIVRAAATYDVGDVVAYRSDELDTTVLHRIVDREGDRFITKGDSNDWLDPDRPVPVDLIGRAWLRVPAGGKAFDAVHSPAGIAALTTAALIGTGLGAGRRHRRRRHRTERRPDAAKATTMTARSALRWRQARTVSAIIAAAAACVALIAWARPTEQTTTTPLPITHRGELTYSAPTGDTIVYEDGTVDTGEPVFLHLVDSINVAFHYNAHAVPEPVSGSIDLHVRLQSGNGWRRTIPLASTTTFEGPNAQVAANLDIRSLIELADEIDEAADAPTSARTVTVLPAVTVTTQGTAAGTFSPRFRFRLDERSLQLADLDEGTEPGEPIVTSEPSTVSRQITEQAHLPAFGRSLRVDHTRLAGAGIAAATAITALAIHLAIRRRTTRIDPIAGRYPSRILTATDVAPTTLPIVEITQIEDLVWLAEQDDRVIIHLANTGHYYLHGDTATYRYTTHPSENSENPTGSREARVDDESGRTNSQDTTAESARLRTIEALRELGPNWSVIQNETLNRFGIDAVAAGPGGILAVTTMDADATPDCQESEAAQRAQLTASRLTQALAKTATEGTRIVPTVMLWNTAKETAVLDGALFLSGDDTEQWRQQLNRSRIPSTSVAAAIAAIRSLTSTPDTSSAKQGSMPTYVPARPPRSRDFWSEAR